MNRTQRLYQKAKKIIPGGTQLLSKRPERYLPGAWPPYYQRARGCRIWDLDGKRYLDFSTMGIGANVLGYADADVNRAVKQAVASGSMSTLNAPEEVELAGLLCRLHPWAEMARFTRSGGEAMTVAVRIARARTKKDIVLFCGYHGWHDWYLSANLADDKALDGHLLTGLKPEGVPRALRGSAMPFNYNDTRGFLELIDRYRGQIAAVVMEPVRNFMPQEGFLETVRDVTRKEKIVFVLDEITVGWRLAVGGAHLTFAVEPDMAVFGKAIGNGYPMAAVIGSGDVMSAAQDSFISSTSWTERIGPAAALATIRKLKAEKVPAYLSRIGKQVQQGWMASAEKYGVPIKVAGIFPLGHFSFVVPEPLVLKTLFAQEMLAKGFLATTAFYASYGHKSPDIAAYLRALDGSFAVIAKALRTGSPRRFLKGPVCQSDFRRLN